MENFHLCTSEFDRTFDSIMNYNNLSKLERYPWIGINYAITNPKVLIVGDSHYATNENGVFSEEALNEFSDKNSTRGVVNCSIESPWKMQKGLYRLFNLNTTESKQTFWSKIAFYNFIQRVMHKTNEKPTDNDFINAWKTLSAVSDILQPDFCLFIGTRSETGIDIIGKGNYEIRQDDSTYINCYPRYGWFMTSNGIRVNFIAIHHTSMNFSHSKWHSYLSERIPDVMRIFEK